MNICPTAPTIVIIVTIRDPYITGRNVPWVQIHNQIAVMPQPFWQTERTEEYVSTTKRRGRRWRTFQHFLTGRVGIPTYLFFSRMLTEKMGRPKEVAHWQEFGFPETDGKKRLNSKASVSQKQGHPASLCDDLFWCLLRGLLKTK